MIYQPFVQLANESLVCSLVNASFDISFEFSNGAQRVTEHSIQVIEPPTNSNGSRDDGIWDDASVRSHNEVFLALANLLDGNVTFAYRRNLIECDQFQSNVLLTGLTACDKISHSYWHTCQLAPRSRRLQDLR
jgi:hypothetical protein